MLNNLKIAILAALEGGKEIIKVYSSHFDVELKSDNSPVTLADKAADKVISEILKTTGIPIISEESRTAEYPIRKDWEQYWLVDPLDGTKEFIKRNGEFTVNIALMSNNIPILGVIYIPANHTLYFTSVDQKSSNKIILSEQELEVLDIIEGAQTIFPAQVTEKIKVLASRSHLNKATEEFIEDLKLNNDVEVINIGSSLKFCMLAEGTANIYPRFGPTMEWDTAAGDAICRAVGISIIDQTTNKVIVYNKASLVNNNFIVQEN